MRSSLGLVLLLAACGGSTPDTQGGADLATPPGPGYDLAMQPVPDGGIAPFSVGIGPINLNSAEETTQCITIKMPNTVDVDVIQLSSLLAIGSHHLILYKSNATTESPTPTPCTPFEGVTTGEVPIFIAESHTSVLTMPQGVSWHFTAGQMVKIEAHYINTTSGTLQGMGSILLTPGSPTVTYQPADIMFCGSVSQLSVQGVPPNTTNFTLNPGFYKPPAGVKVFAFTSHEHRLGSDVKVWKATSASDPGTQLFDNPDWNNPPLQSYPDNNLLTFASGEGLKWQCSYDSADATPPPTTATMFGQSAVSNEMCFIWAYYYPSVGRFISTECWQ